jgi:SAM-dependent methyltransferase
MSLTARFPRATSAAAVVTAALLAHWPALRAGYVLDDETLLAANPYVRTLSGLRVLLTSEFFVATARPEFSAQYRPVSGALNWLSWQLLGDSAPAQHALNIALHAGVGVLLLAVLSACGVRRGIALAAAVLFAVHPATTMDVSYTEGRQDLLGWCFVLGVALAAVRWRSALALAGASFLGTLLAAHCREAFVGAFVGPALLAWGVRPREPRRAVGVVGGGVAAFAVTLALRALVVKTPSESTGWSLGGAVTAAAAAMVRLARDVVLPTDLSLLLTPPELGVGLALLVACVFGASVVASDRLLAARAPAMRPLAWAAWALVATQAAVYAIVLLRHWPMSDRYAYGFVLAAAMLGAACAEAIPAPRPVVVRAVAAGIAALVLAIVPLTWARATDFRSEAALQAAMVEERPDDPETEIAEGLGLFARGDIEGAHPHCAAYAAAHPSSDRPSLCLGLWELSHAQWCAASGRLRPYALARPGYALARSAALEAAFQCNDLAAAREMLTDWEPAFPDAPEILSARRHLDQSNMFSEADQYERFMGRWSRLMAPKLVSFGDVHDGDRVLDVGSGTGVLSFAVEQATRTSLVTGIDPSAQYVEYAQQHASARVTFEVGDAQRMRFGDASFDRTLSLLVINFVPDRAAAVKEMARVTRPGGLVAAAVWDYGDRMQMLRVFWDEAVALDPAAGPFDESHMPVCRKGELAALWRESGLHDVEESRLGVVLHFASFDDYWGPFSLGQGPAGAYVASLTPDRRAALQDRLHRRLLGEGPDHPFDMDAEVWAVKGTVAGQGQGIIVPSSAKSSR